MTQSANIILALEAIGADIKQGRINVGDLTSLPTAAKNSIVAALAELHAAIQDASSIDDSAVDGNTTATYSADKILDLIAAAALQVKNDLVDGAAGALDTLAELATALGNDADYANTVAIALGNRVRFDAAQTLTSPQKVQARTNIGAIDLADVEAAYGDPATNFLAAYVAAKT